MNISLTSEQEDAAEKLEALRAAIAVGIEQADRGDTHPLDAGDTIARLRERIAESKNVKPE